nr:MFS transporter [Pseudonocardia acaciae]
MAYPLFAALSDRLGRRPVTVAGAIGAAVWMFAFFGLVDTRNTGLVVLAVLVGLLCHAAMYGVQASWICELFQTRYRYSGASLGYQLSGIVGGSLAPAIAVWLLRTFHSTVPIQLYVAFGCVVVAATAMVTRETKGADLARAGERETVV